uniref:WD repeat domain, phosphoinositide interacting 1 n=1 Tax=Athene cunicularia TaxID=194338 RepID=A0A663M4Z5_ATHCN
MGYWIRITDNQPHPWRFRYLCSPALHLLWLNKERFDGWRCAADGNLLATTTSTSAVQWYSGLAADLRPRACCLLYLEPSGASTWHERALSELAGFCLCSSLAIGTTTGYRLFSLSSVEQLDQVHESNEIPDVYIVERLFSSSLVVVVSHAKPQQMNVYHFKKGTEICNYSYSSKILSIRLNRQRLVVCLEESIYIHNIKDMKLLKTIMDTPPNTTGLCALSINHANSYLAYPGSATSGEIALYDGNTLKTACTIPAHDGPLAALTFNSTGSKLASASEKGTVIRVFSIPGGQKLYEFRRGMKRYVNISSLVFSMDSQFLCASSNTETVHIFKLEHLTDSRPEEPPTWSGYMGKMFQAATNYLPAQVSGMMNQDRAFATVRLNISGQRNICALSTIQKLPRLLVTTSDGHLCIYNLDPQDGGECVLIKKHSLLGSGKTEENKENDLRPPLPQSYAATVARQSTVPSTSTMPGYSEDGGALRGEVIPEHEFATGPVCLDDENEFPPVSIRDSARKSTPPLNGS